MTFKIVRRDRITGRMEYSVTEVSNKVAAENVARAYTQSSRELHIVVRNAK